MDNTVTSYRTCFSTDSGKRVLGHILLEAGYFDTDLKTPEEQAVLNFVKKILHNTGVCNCPEGMDGFIQKLFELKVED